MCCYYGSTLLFYNFAENQRDMKYPVGIQTFQNIINEGYVYVDKTDFYDKGLRCEEETLFVRCAEPRSTEIVYPTFGRRLFPNKEIDEALDCLDIRRFGCRQFGGLELT